MAQQFSNPIHESMPVINIRSKQKPPFESGCREIGTGSTGRLLIASSKPGKIDATRQQPARQSKA